MQPSSKLVTVLLGAVLLMQFWTLSRQAQLQQELRNVAVSRNEEYDRVQNELEALQRSIRELAEAGRWVVVNGQTVEPLESCETAQARIDWTLREWGAGTTARLLYRSAPDQPWQEANVTRQGDAQSYTATFPVSGKPTLQAGYHVSYAPGKSGKQQEAQAVKAEAAAAVKPMGLDYQYQIIADSPAGSRSTGAKTIPFSHQFVIPAKINVEVKPENGYQVEFYTDRDRGPCARLEGVEVRTYAADQVVEVKPLVLDQAGYRLEWTSPEELHRLELLIKHAGGTETLVIPL